MVHHYSRQLMVVLILFSALPLLSVNMFLPSLGEMARDFGVSYEKMTLAVSGYLIFTAVIQLVAGPLADRFGRRPVSLFALGLFFIASLGCANAQSYEVFLLCRIMQGAIATGLALSRAVVGDVSSPQGAASTLGYISMSMSLAPILGPSLGGVLSETYGWRSNFLFYASSSFLLWVLVWKLLPETSQKPDASNTSFLKSYLELASSFQYWMYTCVLICGISTFFVFVSGIPLIAQSQFQMSQSEIGIIMGTITMGFLIGSFISGLISVSQGTVRMILYGRLFAFSGVGICSLLALLLPSLSALMIIFAAICVGLGNGLSTPSASTAVMFVKKGLAGSASGLSGASVVLFGGIMTSITGMILDKSPTALTLMVIMLTLTLAGLLFALGIAFMKDAGQALDTDAL